MRKTLLAIILLVSCLSAQAQLIPAPATITFYLKKDGKSVTQIEDADYIRTITAISENMFDIKEWYKNNTLKLEGKVSKYQPSLFFEGLVKRYNLSGKLSEEVNYEKNIKKGEAKFYYDNGQLKEVVDYIVNPSAPKMDISGLSGTKSISYFDSLGVQKVKNGNGFAVRQDGNLIEKGKFTDGFKDSIWVGENNKTSFSYQETYSNGKFITGSSIKDGINYTYKELEIMPNFPGGIQEFYKFVGKTYRYPREALKNQVSGRLVLTFVIEKDGSLVDIKSLRDLGFETSEEAIRMLKESPSWIPGKQRGIPVRVQYTLPIMLAPPR